MNKYQEALDKLFVLATNGYCALEVESEEYNYLKETLQELVDNAIQQKPLFSITGLYGCKRCKHIVESVQNYCEHCGQAIDWSDEE